MNTARIDLNLLTVFDAVASSRSVSAAAIKLNLSQPAISHALSRLRKVTGDRLFIRSGQGLVPTPQAETMQSQVRDILESARNILTHQEFDPLRDARRFRIAASDYAALTIVPGLLQRLRLAAPVSNLELASVGRTIFDDMERGEISLSFWGADAPGHPYDMAPLFKESFVGVVWNRHPLARQATVGLDEYLGYPHASVSYGIGVANPVDAALGAINRSRTVLFAGQSFSGNLAAMRGTDLVMALPSRLANHAESLGFKPFTLPFAVAPFPYGIIWHRRTDGDTALAWLRREILTLGS